MGEGKQTRLFVSATEAEKCKELVRAFTPDENKNEKWLPHRARNDVNASYTSKSDQEERESTNLDVGRNTDDPAGAFNAFENDPSGEREENGGRRGGGRGGGRRYKGLESRLVDESDKKFIRRSVGAAPPRREQRKRNEKKMAKKGVKNGATIHGKEGW